MSELFLKLAGRRTVYEKIDENDCAPMEYMHEKTVYRKVQDVFFWVELLSCLQ